MKIAVKIYLSVIVSLLFVLPIRGQEPNKETIAEEGKYSYQSQSFYEVKTFPQKFKSKNPKNIILLIGDGMGVTQIFAGLTANGGHLFLDNFKHVGFSKTQSANKYVTDSGAGGTAIATGKKANNSAVGVDSESQPVPSIIEVAKKNGLSTGIVVTTDITDATPADFIAHVPLRDMSEEIADAFLKSDIDVFIGAGKKHFTDRKDGRNLLTELTSKGYQVCDTITETENIKEGKIVGLLTEQRVGIRGDQLARTTDVALNILKQNPKGFFLMVEGSKIDDGGHDNNIQYIVEEMLDFDKTVGKALEFASQNGETLVVVTADHETGGLTLVGGDMKAGIVKAKFSTGGHTGVMVPVFAYGPGAELFTGINENTSFFDKFIKELKLNE
ncbi:MAG: alkaline phosphatase [Prolixibacteraceae bacterium]|nr:alkaline phosphatase [Prolixibacteraceae bacterium]